MKEQNEKLEKVVGLLRRRGFVWPGSDLYGGLSGTWDYGPMGVLLKENIKHEWLRAMVFEREDVFLLDSAILLNPKVWKASGHVEHFADPLVECRKCKKRFREDELSGNTCPECGGELSEPRQFNMMFKTGDLYLRPETAQGIFINFKNIIDVFHPKLPFGAAQIGKAFRNEITPRNFLFRAREFEQAELEYFVHCDEAKKWFRILRQERLDWFLKLGIKTENIRLRDYEKAELAHYSTATTDVEYRFGFGTEEFSELEGIANRTDFDLRNHFSEPPYDGIHPYVIEPSLGIDRAFLAFLLDAYDEDEMGDERRVVLRLHPRLAPIKIAVFPLVANKEEIVKKAHEIYKKLSTINYKLQTLVWWDDIGNIGKRYRRQDEIGTPWCVTVDYQTLEDNTVTIRDRDTGEQRRAHEKDLEKYFQEKLF